VSRVRDHANLMVITRIFHHSVGDLLQLLTEKSMSLTLKTADLETYHGADNYRDFLTEPDRRLSWWDYNVMIMICC
jgi:hypothetical protein